MRLIEPTTLIPHRDHALKSPARQVHFARNRPWLVVATLDGPGQLIDVVTGTIRELAEPATGLIGAVFPADSDLLAAVATGSVFLFPSIPPPTQQPLLLPKQFRLIGAWGDAMLCQTDAGFELIDAQGKRKPTVSALTLPASAPSVLGGRSAPVVVTSSRGTHALATLPKRLPRSLLLTPAGEWQELATPPQWHPRRASIADDGTVVSVREGQLCHLTRDGQIREVVNLGKTPTCLAVHPEARFVVVAFEDAVTRIIPLADDRAAIGVQDQRDEPSRTSAIAVHPSGHRCALGHDNGVVIIVDSRTGMTLDVLANLPKQPPRVRRKCSNSGRWSGRHGKPVVPSAAPR